MNARFDFPRALIILIAIACTAVDGQGRAEQPIDPAVAKLGRGFVSDTAKVNGATLHYVRGGAGPALILLHGFPQDWYEFHQIMPRLAKKSTVIAVDLRGVGGSEATPGGYDAANLAADIHQLVQRLKLGRVYVAGHDIGGMVAYAFARLYPQTARGVMILEAPLPGFQPSDDVNARLWHVGFHQMPSLPENMIAGRQAVYFREAFFNTGTLNHTAISDADVARYAKSYVAPAKLRAGLEFYRAFPANARFNAAHREAIDIPLVLAGGDSADKAFGALFPELAKTLQTYGWSNVTTELIKNSGHYVVDEQPEMVAELIERYALP